MAVPRIPRNANRPKLKRPHGWPSVSPYDKDDAIVKGQKTAGRKVKTCPVNSEGKTIFRPEWYHGTQSQLT